MSKRSIKSKALQTLEEAWAAKTAKFPGDNEKIIRDSAMLATSEGASLEELEFHRRYGIMLGKKWNR